MRNIIFLLYCIYLYFFYHLLVIPAFAEFSFFALLIVPFMLLAFWLVPKERRKEAVFFTFLFLFMDQAITNIIQKSGPMFYIWVVFIGLFLYPIAKLYAKIRLPAVAIALAVALLFNIVLPDRTVLALPHLYPKWSSEKLYIGSVTESFPVAVIDMDQDGSDEIITLGNTDFYPEGKREARFSYMLDNEPLHLLVWKWQNDSLERVPNEQLDVQVVRDLLPKDFIAFPYYTLNESLELEPLVQRQWLTESMMQFGSSPFQALRINLENLERQFQANGYIYDQMDADGSYTNVLLKDGFLSGLYEDIPFRVASPATKIIGTIELEDGAEGLLVLGLNVELLQMVDGELNITHTLTREMQSSLALSRFISHDLTQNGKQEFIVTFPFSTILEPTPEGGWYIHWATDERSFNIKDVGSFSQGNSTEILALRKSAVRASDVSYLTSYYYASNRLGQNWKIFLRDIDTAEFGDLNGDGQNELITTIYGKQKVYVWGKHSIPVTGILVGLTLLLILYMAGRRYSYAKQQKA